LPDLSLLLATFLSLYGWVILKELTHKKKNINITTINGSSMLIAGLIASIHAFLTHSYLIKGANPYTFIQMLIVLTLISNIICCNLYGILLKKHSATFLSFIGILCIFFSAIHGYIFLGEKPSTTIFLSSFIIALGIWLFYKSEQHQTSLLKKY